MPDKSCWNQPIVFVFKYLDIYLVYIELQFGHILHIWCVQWSLFSGCGGSNYMPSDTTTTNLHRSDGGALKGGLSRPLALLTKTWWLIVCSLCTPPFIPINNEIVPWWLALGEHRTGRRRFLLSSLAARSLSIVIGRQRRCQWSRECVLSGAVSKLWKVVCWSRFLILIIALQFMKC